MAITTDQIIAAADQIAASGGTPTLAAVRAAVGGGSYTTISEALKAWRGSQSLPEASAPVALTGHLAAVASSTWALAMRLASAQLDDVRASLTADRSALAQDRAVMTAQLDDARARAERAEQQTRAMTQDLLHAEVAAAAARAGLDAAEREIVAAKDDARAAKLAATAAGEALAALRGQFGVGAPAQAKKLARVARQGKLLP